MMMVATMADTINHATKEPWPSLEWAAWWFDRAGFVLIGALVVGVATTAIIVWMGIVKEHHWDLARETAQLRIAQLDNETARLHAQNVLTSDSLLANVHAARSNAITGQATRTVTERIAVAQGLVDPKSISEAGRSLNAIPKVKPFAGSKFDAAVTSSDIELGTLLVTLEVALKNAGWLQIERSYPIAGVGIFAVDRKGGPALVRIEVDGSKDPEPITAAGALASALNEEGIAAKIEMRTETDAANANVIHILVGPKP
jgi:hypothetical protein